EGGIRRKLVTGVQTCALPIFRVGGAFRRAVAHRDAPNRRMARQETRVRCERAVDLGEILLEGPPVPRDALLQRADRHPFDTRERSEERRVGKEGWSRGAPGPR